MKFPIIIMGTLILSSPVTGSNAEDQKEEKSWKNFVQKVGGIAIKIANPPEEEFEEDLKKAIAESEKEFEAQKQKEIQGQLKEQEDILKATEFSLKESEKFFSASGLLRDRIAVLRGEIKGLEEKVERHRLAVEFAETDALEALEKQHVCSWKELEKMQSELKERLEEWKKAAFEEVKPLVQACLESIKVGDAGDEQVALRVQISEVLKAPETSE